MLNKLKSLFESTHTRSAAIAGLGAGIAYLGAALTIGIPAGGWAMLLASAGSVAVNAIWQNLKNTEPSPTPAK